MGTNHEDTHINESILSEEILEDQKKNRIDHMTYLPGMEDIGSEILDQVVAAMESYDYNTYTAEDVKRALAHTERTPEDFQALLSPAALPFLEEIAQAAQIETRKHFGNSVYMFTPIYIANYCENYCIYCGFNCHNKINRAQLNAEEIEKEMAAIAETGLQEILILTGESRNKSTVEYIGEACKIARKYFKVIGLEVYPVNSDEYAYLHECGADYVTVFQETYNSDKYETLHLAGHKRIYPYRVNAQERALKSRMDFPQISTARLSGFSRAPWHTGQVLRTVSSVRRSLTLSLSDSCCRLCRLARIPSNGFVTLILFPRIQKLKSMAWFPLPYSRQ